MSNFRSGGIPKGISLANTVHSEVAPCLPLPSLPVFCGALDQDLRLIDDPVGSVKHLNRSDVADQATKISKLLLATDVSYLNLKMEVNQSSYGHEEHLDLYTEVLRCNSEVFEYIPPGPANEQMCNNMVPNNKVSERKLVVQNLSSNNEALKDKGETQRPHQHDVVIFSSRKPKSKKKANDDTLLSTEPDGTERQDAAVESFCEVLEDLCGRAEVSMDDREEGEAEWLLLPVGKIRNLEKEVMSIRASKFLHFVPVLLLERMLKVLDHHIHSAEGLSINQSENSNSDVVSTIAVALESIHAAIAIMAYDGMPKQIYKEEIIERIVEFSRRQIGDVMTACDPAFRPTNNPTDNGSFQDEDDDDYDEEFGSATKRRRTAKATKVKRSGANRTSAAAHNILQKLCTIIGFLKDLLMIERLSDSCILQLVKTCFSTLLVDNIQLLQLKAISVLGGIFYCYAQHRVYVMDELLHLLLKLPFSKRIPRTYHLADDEQRQIQMITALLIQLINCSGNLPASLREASDSNPLFNIGIDSSYLHKSQEAVTEACCLFWSRVLQRFANTKTQNQEASEFKIMLENLVMDLISTLNLPEYPASAHILEVLCVLLLQNAGLKSKDIAARSIAIDILGTVAAKLKCEAVLCKKEKFWIVQELVGGDDTDDCPPNDACSVCLDSRIEKPLVTCEGCQRLFHVDCLGISEHEVSGSSWLCQLCLCKKQLFFLQSYCKSQGGGEGTHTRKKSKSSDSADITKTEIVQQMLLNYLQDSGSAEDVHIFTRWFYICLWYKEDPTSQEKFLYYLARLKSKSVVRGSGMVSSPLLTRSSIKKITLALAQNSSFPRGFDKILYLLLASLREGSPVIRAKALRAVSIIVEADPEVLGDKYVQTAVEGRFCDSAISVREAALELVGRYIASHPNVALRYYGKVAERVKDTGVSVRKRAIKIIKDMCASNANFPEFNSACIEILSRISDEESSIQDLVCKTFYEFWFEESSGSQNQIFAEGSSITLEIAKKTEQMVEMLRKMPNNQFLVIVIKRNLALDFLPQSAKAAGISHVMLASVRKRCELMCKCLLEKILRVEENINEVDAGALHYVLLLHAFCLVNPALCAPASNPSQFVVTLQPYLKKQANNRAVAQLVECIVFVIDSVLPLVRKLPQSVVEELEQDLKQMIVRHSFFTVVHACIKCLCSMSKVSGTGSSVVGYLIQVFLKRLDFLGFNNIQQVCRSLFCLGLLIRYGSSLLGMSLSSKQNLAVVGSLSLFKKYFHAEDFALKIRSLQALGYVLIARPEFMLEKDIENILETTLSSSTDDRLKMQSLQNLYEYLQDAEHQMENDKAENDTVTYNTVAGTAVPVAAGAGDTNICGGIIQLYWNSILGRCLDADEDVRQSTLKIVEIVLRQGLVHPITCVPYLIALETDPQEANSKLAHHLLMNMNEKYPAFFESRLGDGLQMSFIFMQAMSQSSSENSNSKVHTKSPNNAKGKSEGTSFSYARLGVSRIYKVIRGNRVSRNKFMSSIVRKFDTPGWHNSVVLFLIYCTEILSLLPFALPEEPLYLIYAINRVLQVRSGAVESNMKAFLHKLQEQNRKEPANGIVQHEPFAQPVPKENSFVDDNRQVDQEFPNEISFTHAVPVEPDQHSMIQDKPIIISADDLPNIQANCLAACALQLLLKLKRHLKIVYGLDDARCQAFSPTDPAKPGEFLTRQNIPFVVGETNITRPTTYEDVLQRYQEFKNALREDTVDYSVYTANIKRKRPPGRKSMKAVPVPGRMNCGNNGDDDDDDDDENWGSGAHITSGGRRGGGMSTRSRQRL